MSTLDAFVMGVILGGSLVGGMALGATGVLNPYLALALVGGLFVLHVVVIVALAQESQDDD